MLTSEIVPTSHTMTNLNFILVTLSFMGTGCIECLRTEDGPALFQSGDGPIKTHGGGFRSEKVYIGDSVDPGSAFVEEDTPQTDRSWDGEALQRGQPDSTILDEAAKDGVTLLPCFKDYVPSSRKSLSLLGSNFGRLSPTLLDLFAQQDRRRLDGGCRLESNRHERSSLKFWLGEKSPEGVDTKLIVKFLRHIMTKRSSREQMDGLSAIARAFPLDRPQQMYTSRGTMVKLQRVEGVDFIGDANSVLFQDVGKSGVDKGGLFVLKFFPRHRGMKRNDEQREIESKLKILKLIPKDISPRQLFYTRRLILPLEIVVLPRSRWAIPRSRGPISDVALVMPLIKSDLQQIINSRELHAMTQGVRTCIAMQMVQLVAGLHDFGIVHGALSATSFLMSKSGMLYLSNFENASRVSELHACSRTTVRNTSPELVQCVTEWADSASKKGFKCLVEANFAADSWALGLLLHDLWCKHDPFGRSALHETEEEKEFLEETARISSKGESNIIFSDCIQNVPLRMRNIIRGLLHPLVEFRLRPSCALSAHL